MLSVLTVQFVIQLQSQQVLIGPDHLHVRALDGNGLEMESLPPEEAALINQTVANIPHRQITLDYFKCYSWINLVPNCQP